MFTQISHTSRSFCSTGINCPDSMQLKLSEYNKVLKLLCLTELKHYYLLNLLIRLLTSACMVGFFLAMTLFIQVVQANPVPNMASAPTLQAVYSQEAQLMPIPHTQDQGVPEPYMQTVPYMQQGQTAQQNLANPTVFVAPNGQVNTRVPQGQVISTPNMTYPSQELRYAPHGMSTISQRSGTNPFPLAVSLDETDLALLKELSKAQNSKSTKLNSKPFISKPGEVSFIFGASQPTVVCSLLHVCDIALEPGENVVDIKVGDSARWIIERSASGSSEGIIEHITIKPTDTNLQSNLRIYTDRRAYSIDLKSSTQDFMPSVTFVYPENTLQKYAQVKAQLQQQQAAIARDTVHMGQQSFSLTDLNFNYVVEGDKTIKPLRVFNDTRKTYIQMSPQLMRQNRLPALVAVHDPGGFFTDAKTAMINYRIIDNNFVVDGLPTHLRLILGQDNDQATSVDIKLQTP